MVEVLAVHYSTESKSFARCARDQLLSLASFGRKNTSRLECSRLARLRTVESCGAYRANSKPLLPCAHLMHVFAARATLHFQPTASNLSSSIPRTIPFIVPNLVSRSDARMLLRDPPHSQKTGLAENARQIVVMTSGAPRPDNPCLSPAFCTL